MPDNTNIVNGKIRENPVTIIESLVTIETPTPEDIEISQLSIYLLISEL
jgi:hypothetical protein